MAANPQLSLDDDQGGVSAIEAPSAFGLRSHIGKDRLYVLKRGHLFCTPGLSTTLHPRGYVLLVLSIDPAERFRFVANGAEVAASAVVVRATHPRTFRAEHTALAAILINPLHPDYARFRALKGSGVAMLDRTAFSGLDAGLAAALKGESTSADADALFADAVSIALGSVPPIEPPDWRAVEAMRHLLTHHEATVADLARHVSLSTDRLTHLFSDSFGISLRTCLSWLRIHRTAAHLDGGFKLTDIAKMVAFADLAHMSRVFHRTFGASPSYFLKGDNVELKVARWQ